MAKRKKTNPRRTKNADRTIRSREWIGGRFSPPFYITEGGPRRVDMFLWIELPEALAVNLEGLDPDQPAVSFGASLLNAMQSPLVGPARQPARIRVATEQLAAEIRQVAPDIPVTVAPTPEFDRLMGRMMASMESMSDAEEFNISYFEGGRISEDAVEELFVAAKHLYTLAPWKVASDSDVVRLDLPNSDSKVHAYRSSAPSGRALG